MHSFSSNRAETKAKGYHKGDIIENSDRNSRTKGDSSPLRSFSRLSTKYRDLAERRTQVTHESSMNRKVEYEIFKKKSRPGFRCLPPFESTRSQSPRRCLISGIRQDRILRVVEGQTAQNRPIHSLRPLTNRHGTFRSNDNDIACLQVTQTCAQGDDIQLSSLVAGC